MAKILVIEDNPENMQLITYLLRTFGHIAIEATDGQTGLNIIIDQAPDLILCDLQMPGIDGYEVIRRIKQNPKLVNISIVAVTAYAMVGDQEKILATGFNGYISKPINPETFVKEIEKFLQQTK